MWIITNQQLIDISQSMRVEFENRAFFILSQESYLQKFTEEELRSKISKKMDEITSKDIEDENVAMQIIRSALEANEVESSVEYEIFDLDDDPTVETFIL